jgi:hypothetical protein
MSHKATHWAIQQRGLKPATKIVLWFLCDRHNPDFGCFPTQARLAEDAEMSISALNDHLARLEQLRLIHRVRTHDPRTHKRQATRYILGFEESFPQEPAPEIGDGNQGTDDEQGADPTPDSGHGAISGFAAEPSPDFAQSHLRNPETNLVREPVKEEEDAQAREAVCEDFFAKLLAALGIDPDDGLPGWWQGWPPREHVRRWRDDLGLDEAAILVVAKASRLDHPEPPDGPKALDRAMQRAARRLKQTGVTVAAGRPSATTSTGDTRRRKRDVAPRPGDDELAAFYADLVNSDRFLPANTISNTMRDALLVRGLVTAEQLRQRGVQ